LKIKPAFKLLCEETLATSAEDFAAVASVEAYPSPLEATAEAKLLTFDTPSAAFVASTRWQQ
jgi:hypothetical protein